MKVQIYEVTPRDGLQNESKTIPTATKIDLINKLVEAGHTDIEITSFVKPSWIPQLADSDHLVRSLGPAPDGVRYWCLIPNRRGLERAIDAGAENIATFLSASQSHNRKNLNRTQRETLNTISEVIGVARDEEMGVRVYLSTVFGCPFEGDVDPNIVRDICHRLLDFGAETISLGDTTGMGNPNQVTALLNTLSRAQIPLERLALHMHDTRGTALANCLVGYQAGIRVFDGSTAGVGGCPYAPGAAGNAATEDLHNMFQSMGIDSGVQLPKSADVGVFLHEVLGRELPGRYHRFYMGTLQRAKQTA